MLKAHLSFSPNDPIIAPLPAQSIEEILLRQEAARRRKLFRKVKAFIVELKEDGGITTPFSSVRGLGDNNQFLKRGPGKIPKSHGGSPPFEYTVVEMLADLQIHLDKEEDEKVAPLFFALKRILKR